MSSSNALLTQALIDHEVVPHVLSQSPADLAVLGVAYNGNEFQPGVELPRKDTLPEPTLTCSAAKESERYVVIMVDPDLFKTNDQMSGQVRHWLQEVKFVSGQGTLGKVVSKYIPCTPGAGTGKHRYIFLLCQQMSGSVGPEDFVGAPNEDLKDRMKFNVEQYIMSKNLKLIAANFMLVSADAKSTVENIGLAAQSLGHKLTGQH